MENYGVHFFRALDPILWALKEDHTLYYAFSALLTLTKLFYLIKTIRLPCFIISDLV